MEFEAFPKIPRLSRGCTITEKIDGTNAQVAICLENEVLNADKVIARDGKGLVMLAGSRTRWIIPGDDNFGFAAWVDTRAEELFGLGAGRHFGEWWGPGIQRRYGIAEKRFSLFNAKRWTENAPPACCSVVPIIYEGLFTSEVADAAVDRLRREGSLASPGFMLPEGIIVYQHAARTMFKKTLEKDAQAKGEQ